MRTKLLWMTADTQSSCALCNFLLLLGEGSANTVKNNNQPTNQPTNTPPSTSLTCHLHCHWHQCEWNEKQCPPLSSCTILMEIASLNKHSGLEMRDTHRTVCLAIVTNQADTLIALLRGEHAFECPVCWDLFCRDERRSSYLGVTGSRQGYDPEPCYPSPPKTLAF